MLTLFLVLQWIDTRWQMAQLREDIARRLATSERQIKENTVLAQAAQNEIARIKATVDALDDRVAETQSQAVALQAMYQEISSSRDERLLAEVEQAVSIALQQLQFAGNVEAALLALQGAEARLARANQPRFLQIRRLIARDIERLKATPGADVTGLSLKIESVVATIDNLPLAFERRPQQDSPTAGQKPAASPSGAPSEPLSWGESLAGTVRSLGADLWHELRQLARIERIEQGDPALLAPSQSYFLRENIKLRLLSARLALLQRDGRSFKEQIGLAREALDRYFDVKSKPVQTAQTSLRALAAADVGVELPRLIESLGALRSVKLAQERAPRK